MAHELSVDLHRLTARLDRSADRILRAEHGLSYRRFRALLSVERLGAATQRAIAEDMGVSEPSASRMTGVLVDLGLLTARRDPAGGNRRRLHLTADGADLVGRCRLLLEDRFDELVRRSGVSYDDYARATRLLLETLDTTVERDVSGQPSTAS